ncbi:hypothetical protein D3C71_1700170 [compost metagenome]
MQVTEAGQIAGVHVSLAERACGRTFAEILHLRIALQHLRLQLEAGRVAGIPGDPGDINLLPGEILRDVLAERILAQPADPPGRQPQPRQADGDIDLRSGEAAAEGVDILQGTGPACDEHNHSLSKSYRIFQHGCHPSFSLSASVPFPA